MVKPFHKPVRERVNISQLALAHPWLTMSFWIAIAVAGMLAFSSLKYALLPDITFPVVMVNAKAPLSTASDTERQLLQPIEKSLNSLKHTEEIRSSTYPGQTAVTLSFTVGTNLETVGRQVETALKKLSLPQGATFSVHPVNLNESAAITYTIKSPSKNLTQLTKLASERIIPLIGGLPGVSKVVLLGAPDSSSSPKVARGAVELPQGTTAIQFNGQEALAFQVVKHANANTLEVVTQVEKVIQQQQLTLPDVQLVLATSQAEYIHEATQATIEALALAVALSVVVILPFLRNWQATLISALAIPISLFGTFIVMATCGFNLETVTLLALTLSIGIIVDDAIVDVENITRHLEAGKPLRLAAISATNEIGLTVIAVTFTIVAVFLPVGLMNGVVGQFFKPFGLTVSAAVLTSLLVARTLSPLLAVYWLSPKSPQRQSQLWTSLIQSYQNMLNWSLGHRGLVLGLALFSFIVGLALTPMIPKGFMPKLDRGEFNIAYTLPPDASLHTSRSVAHKLEVFVRQSPQVQAVFTVVGSRQGEPNKGTLSIKLRDDRSIQTSELQEQFRHSLPTIPGVTTSVKDIQFIDTGDEKPLQVALLGKDLVALSRAAKAIKFRIQHLPGFVDVTATGEVDEQGHVFEIEHLNTQRVAYISANLSPNLTLGNATDRVVNEAKAILPPGIDLNLGGDSARIGEIFGSFGITLGLSVGCILLVLILLFKSFVKPLVIVLSLPLSVVGAILALLLTGNDFSMISLIGMIFLLDLVNKNAILLVDYINQLHHQSGLNRTEAILQAGTLRLRPILMTTAATILGMLPIALGWGAGSELRAPMAIAIIGGLVTSTLLSLIVVPVVYVLLDDWRFLNSHLT